MVGIHDTNDDWDNWGNSTTQSTGWVNMVTDPVIEAENINYQKQ